MGKLIQKSQWNSTWLFLSQQERQRAWNQCTDWSLMQRLFLRGPHRWAEGFTTKQRRDWIIKGVVTPLLLRLTWPPEWYYLQKPSSETKKTRFVGAQLIPNAPHHLWGKFKTCTNHRAGFNAFIFYVNAQLSARAVKWEPQLTGFKHISRVCFSSLTLFAGEQKLSSETCLQNNGDLSHPSASIQHLFTCAVQSPARQLI